MAAVGSLAATPSAHRSPRSQAFAQWIASSLGIATFVGLWLAVTLGGLVSPQFLPSPPALIERVIELAQQPYAGSLLQQHLLASLEKFGVSYLIAVFVGVPLGLMMGRFRVLDWAVTPLFEMLRFIPPIAWVPFSILWFGTGFLAPTLVIFAGAFSPCVLNAYRGARQIDPTMIEAAQTLGARGYRMIKDIVLPGALPHVVAGMRVAAGFGWQSLIGAELIVGSTGLGYLIIQGESNIEPAVVVAGMLTIGVVGAIIDYAMRALEDWIRRDWGH
ncbi:MAG TPA: ABC transporter permease [Casimicrobiaceae bacterium]|nr:ABC transporter permease [Casimicrobiaceae bacterium]